MTRPSEQRSWHGRNTGVNGRRAGCPATHHNRFPPPTTAVALPRPVQSSGVTRIAAGSAAGRTTKPGSLPARAEKLSAAAGGVVAAESGCRYRPVMPSVIPANHPEIALDTELMSRHLSFLGEPTGAFCNRVRMGGEPLLKDRSCSVRLMTH